MDAMKSLVKSSRILIVILIVYKPFEDNDEVDIRWTLGGLGIIQTTSTCSWGVFMIIVFSRVYQLFDDN